MSAGSTSWPWMTAARQIDGDEVGDPRNQDVGEFLDGAVEIQRAADTDTGLVDQREVPSRTVVAGDIEYGLAQAHGVACGVLQPEGRTGADVRHMGSGVAGVDVGDDDLWLTGLQHLPGAGFRHRARPFGDGVAQCASQP